MSVMYRPPAPEQWWKSSAFIHLMRGVTLIELMVTLAIMGIVMALAAPSFQETIANNRTVTVANQLITTLAFARSEAIKRGVQITIKRKGSTSGRWESGWDVFTDSTGDGTMNGADSILKTYDTLPVGYTLRTVGTYANDWIAYLGTGFSKGSGTWTNDQTFRLCDSSGSTAKSRAITINTLGRATVTEGTVSCP